MSTILPGNQESAALALDGGTFGLLQRRTAMFGVEEILEFIRSSKVPIDEIIPIEFDPETKIFTTENELPTWVPADTTTSIDVAIKIKDITKFEQMPRYPGRNGRFPIKRVDSTHFVITGTASVPTVIDCNAFSFCKWVDYYANTSVPLLYTGELEEGVTYMFVVRDSNSWNSMYGTRLAIYQYSGGSKYITLKTNSSRFGYNNSDVYTIEAAYTFQVNNGVITFGCPHRTLITSSPKYTILELENEPVDVTGTYYPNVTLYLKGIWVNDSYIRVYKKIK